MLTIDRPDVQIGNNWSKSDDRTIGPGRAPARLSCGQVSENENLGEATDVAATAGITFVTFVRSTPTTLPSSLICRQLKMSQPHGDHWFQIGLLNFVSADHSNACLLYQAATHGNGHGLFACSGVKFAPSIVEMHSDRRYRNSKPPRDALIRQAIDKRRKALDFSTSQAQF